MQLLLSAAYTLPTLEVIARGGGGGSGSGGGSGGGGGSVIAAIGYLPCHFVSAWGAKNYTKLFGVVAGAITGVIVTFIMGALLLPYLPFELFLVFAGAIAGVWAGSQNLLGRLKTVAQKTKIQVAAAASKDPAWHEESLRKTIAQTFADYQKDWSTFNVEHIRTYTTPRYFQQVSLLLAALHVMGRQNNVAEPKLMSQYIAEIIDAPDDNKDAFTAVIIGRAKDQLIDKSTNTILYSDSSAFTEYWRFKRSGNTWLLDGIEQATAEASLANRQLRAFAEQSNMFYSLDMGWLLLPKRGQLFGEAKFGRSDVNNHVIGQWNGVLVQLYTYFPTRQDMTREYQIAQITLPKSYGGIIIKRKKMLNFAPAGYQKITFEWPDFNNRYVVYATDADKVTSFELLNPKFMANLYDQNLKVEIEVVDNVVYLYSKVTAGQTNYPAMLDILQQAFHELKL